MGALNLARFNMLDRRHGSLSNHAGIEPRITVKLSLMGEALVLLRQE